MKILHILSTSSYSGAENVVITIIKQIEKDDEYKAYYVSPSGEINKKLEEENVKHITIRELTPKEIKRVIKEYNPDVIHAHDFRASVITALVTPKNIKLISHIHCIPNWLKSINAYSLIYAVCSIKYKDILLVSKEIMDVYIFRKIIRKKCKVVGNIIDEKKVIEKSKKEMEMKKYDICFNGRLVNEKDPFKFIKIVKEIKKHNSGITAVMIGEGELRKACEELIVKEGLEKNIYMTGFLDNPYCVMKKCKILCITSESEGYGLVAAEALALEKPVVATNVGGIPNIVDETCGIVCDNTEIMVKEIMKLLEDEEYYEYKSKNTNNKLMKINNFHNYIENLKQIYNRK